MEHSVLHFQVYSALFVCDFLPPLHILMFLNPCCFVVLQIMLEVIAKQSLLI